VWARRRVGYQQALGANKSVGKKESRLTWVLREEGLSGRWKEERQRRKRHCKRDLSYTTNGGVHLTLFPRWELNDDLDQQYHHHLLLRRLVDLERGMGQQYPISLTK